MTTPYRIPPPNPSARRARRRRLSAIGVGLAFIWSMSVVRLVIASEHDERFGFDMALATLFGAGTPVALLSRPVRDALRGVGLDPGNDEDVETRRRETSGQG